MEEIENILRNLFSLATTDIIHFVHGVPEEANLYDEVADYYVHLLPIRINGSFNIYGAMDDSYILNITVTKKTTIDDLEAQKDPIKKQCEDLTNRVLIELNKQVRGLNYNKSEIEFKSDLVLTGILTTMTADWGWRQDIDYCPIDEEVTIDWEDGDSIEWETGDPILW